MTRPWVCLLLAGLLEVMWAVLLPRTAGFTKLVPTIITLVPLVVSFYLLSEAVRVLPIGTSYAIWTGIGAAGTVLFGIFFAGEPSNWFRLLCIALILLGTLGLKLGHG
ncbi:MAG: multidrug efflux SMR transporter [Bacteriovoracia bacterium]